MGNNSGGGWSGHTQANLYWLVNTDDLPHVKKAHEVYQKENPPLDAPTIFLVVKALPKGALVEKQSLLHTGRCMITDGDDGEISLQPRKPMFEQSHTKFGDNGALHWEVSRFDDTTASCAIICVRDGDNHRISDIVIAATSLTSLWTRTLSIRLFYIPSRASSFSSLSQRLFSLGCPPITSIPCRLISTRETNNWDYVICILAT